MEKPKLYCVVGKTCSGKDYIGQKISNIYKLPKIAVSDLIKIFCQQNDITPSRENMIKLGNGHCFTGQNIAKQFLQILPKWWIISGIRKPETLSELQKVFDTIMVGIVADDETRYDRYISRLDPQNTKDIYKSFTQFIDDEVIENSWPNKQSVQMILNMSDRYIHNPSTIYSDIDESIARMFSHIKYQPNYTHDKNYVDSQWYKHFARAIIHNQYWQILLLQDKNKWYAVLPWGKLDKWENPEQAIRRELQEELDIRNITKIQYLWWIWGRYPDWLSKWHYFQVYTDDVARNMEKQNFDIKYIYPKLLSEKSYINTGIYHYENNWRFDHLNFAQSNDHLIKIHRI